MLLPRKNMLTPELEKKIENEATVSIKTFVQTFCLLLPEFCLRHTLSMQINIEENHQSFISFKKYFLTPFCVIHLRVTLVKQNKMFNFSEKSFHTQSLHLHKTYEQCLCLPYFILIPTSAPSPLHTKQCEGEKKLFEKIVFCWF